MSDHPLRKWKKEHRQAGYHRQQWAWEELGHDHPVCGAYRCRDGSHMTVRFLEAGHSGAPELEIEWTMGRTVTVLDASVAEAYLKQHGAVRP